MLFTSNAQKYLHIWSKIFFGFIISIISIGWFICEIISAQNEQHRLFNSYAIKWEMYDLYNENLLNTFSVTLITNYVLSKTILTLIVIIFTWQFLHYFDGFQMVYCYIITLCFSFFLIANFFSNKANEIVQIETLYEVRISLYFCMVLSFILKSLYEFVMIYIYKKRFVYTSYNSKLFVLQGKSVFLLFLYALMSLILLNINHAMQLNLLNNFLEIKHLSILIIDLMTSHDEIITFIIIENIFIVLIIVLALTQFTNTHYLDKTLINYILIIIHVFLILVCCLFIILNLTYIKSLINKKVFAYLRFDYSLLALMLLSFNIGFLIRSTFLDHSFYRQKPRLIDYIAVWNYKDIGLRKKEMQIIIKWK